MPWRWRESCAILLKNGWKIKIKVEGGKIAKGNDHQMTNAR